MPPANDLELGSSRRPARAGYEPLTPERRQPTGRWAATLAAAAAWLAAAAALVSLASHWGPAAREGEVIGQQQLFARTAGSGRYGHYADPDILGTVANNPEIAADGSETGDAFNTPDASAASDAFTIQPKANFPNDSTMPALAASGVSPDPNGGALGAMTPQQQAMGQRQQQSLGQLRQPTRGVVPAPMPMDGPATQVVLGAGLAQLPAPPLEDNMSQPVGVSMSNPVFTPPAKISPILAFTTTTSARSTAVVPSDTATTEEPSIPTWTTTTTTTTTTATKGATTETTLTTTTHGNTTIPLRSVTLFCWALMMPHGDEVSLLRTLLAQGVGLFGCNKYSVFSSGDVELSPGPPVRIVATDIGSVSCNYGGPWHLALNSEVFIKVWKRIFKDKFYAQNDWTIKIDPDAVFLPDRLRKLVLHADPDAVVYLNNCDQGLHGPIEVIALGGMQVFNKGIERCEKHLRYEFGRWGEDVFLRHCLGLLKVNRVDNFQLLSEDRCFYENPAQTGCNSGKVSFHPFKKPDMYFRCLKQAGGMKRLL